MDLIRIDVLCSYCYEWQADVVTSFQESVIFMLLLTFHFAATQY